MSGFIAGIARLLVRVILLCAGLMFAAALFAALLLFVILWAVGAGWARLTGRPTSPFVMRFNVGKGFGRVVNAESRWMREPPMKKPQPEPLREIPDITDVEARESPR